MGCGCSSTTASYRPDASAGHPAVPAEPMSPEMAGKFAELFGGDLEKLLGKNGEVGVEVALAGKEAIGIYFSAHWCPPCRGFTPLLAKYYKDDLRSKGLEIIFVSSDQTEGQFRSYYKEMPWLAVPYSRRDVQKKLNKKFKVQGIPSLVILDKSGEVITIDGRTKVSSDPTGQAFPWKPKPFIEVIGNSFRKGDALVGKDAIAGKTLGIYFSAHWCPPCRGFTPTLAKHYKAYKERGLPFEIVFSTGDRDEASFESYYKEMVAEGGDWLAIPWASSAQRGDLDSLFEVSGIPCLVIVDENGKVINKNARSAVASDPTGESFPWAPPAVGNLASPDGIDEAASVCIFMEGVAPQQQKNLVSEMEKVVKKYIQDAAAVGKEPAYRFYSATSNSGAVPEIRRLCGLPKDAQEQPVMLLLDLDDDGAFYTPIKQDDVSIASIESFISDYEGKMLTRQQMSR